MGCWKRQGEPIEKNEEFEPGPQNTITIRTVTHLSHENRLQHERVPDSQGNTTWGTGQWNNSVKTSEYTWWNFLILNLFRQCIVPANAYFLVMSILQLIPAISDSEGVPTYLVPISFVFLVTMVKDAIEDTKRHKADTEENRNKTLVLDHNGNWAERKWHDILPGDIVRVEAEEQFPADLLLITCSDEFGIAYVNTVQLDGETNMKTKTAIPSLHEAFGLNTQDLCKLKIEMFYGPPSAKLYTFGGVMKCYDVDHDFTKSNQALRSTLSKRKSLFGSGEIITHSVGQLSVDHIMGGPTPVVLKPPSDTHIPVQTSLNGKEFPISINQFLWRGATLVNTNWICGVAVYTGHQTRVYKNTKSREGKKSSLLRSYDHNAISLFILEVAFCLLICGLYVVDVKRIQSKSWYLQPESSRELAGTVSSGAAAFFISLGRYILLLSYFLPITLLVQIEIARWFHQFYIHSDRLSYYKETDRYPTVSTLGVIEDLGNITHVFSDKTGTLTQNVMQLKSFAINGHIFGDELLEEDDDTSTRRPASQSDADDIEEEYKQCLISKQETKMSDEKSIHEMMLSPCPFVRFDAASARKFMVSQGGDPEGLKASRMFLMVLSICHSVLPKPSTVFPKGTDPEPTSHVNQISPPGGSSPAPVEKKVSRRSTGSSDKDISAKTRHSADAAPSTATRPSPDLGSSSSSMDLAEQKQCRRDNSVNHARNVTETDESQPFNSGRHSASTYTRSNESFAEPLSSRSSGRTLEKREANQEVLEFPVQAPTSTADQDQDPGPQASYRAESSWNNSVRSRSLRSERKIEPSTSLKASAHATPHAVSPVLPSRAHVASRTGRASAPPETVRGPDRVGPTVPKIIYQAFPPRLKGQVRPPPNVVNQAIDVMDPSYTGTHMFEPEVEHQAAAPDSSRGSERVLISAVSFQGSLDAAYDASSPDELALVAGAKHLGVEFLRRPNLGSLTLTINNKNVERIFMCTEDIQWIVSKRAELNDPALVPALTFSILDVLDFDNFRKRMSVIVRDRDGSILLLTKGADSSMIAVAAPGHEQQLAEMSDSLADFAREGLRTLVLGYRYLSEDEFHAYQKEVSSLRATGTDDAERFAEIFGKIETNLALVGCTAINDKLQDEVAETIEALKEADVRVWVLTGDKVETAIAIGHSCNLLSDTTYNAVIDGSTLQEVQNQMYEYMAFVVGGQLAREAFDEIVQYQLPAQTDEVLISPGGNMDDDSPRMNNASGRCHACKERVMCCSKGVRENRRKKKKIGDARPTATMSFDDFIRVLTFNAKHKKVVAPVDGRDASPKQLSAEEVERLIEVYVGRFQAAEDDPEKRGALSKIGDFVSGKRHAPTSPNAEQPKTSKASPDRNRSPERGSPDGSIGDLRAMTPSNKIREGDVEQFTNVAITITGDALHLALSTKDTRKYFFGLAHLCSTVIACRVTPKQKAEVVRQCGRCTPADSFVSLGIGDGANDVGMILTADVGVGIYGKEGSQAARSADLAIGEFKILRNLLFVHGHTILRRHSLMMYQTIFKNILFVIPTYFSGILSGFAASDTYNSYLKQFFNLFFTPWAVMSLAVFDRHLPYDILLRCGSLYPHHSTYYGVSKFTAWFLYAIVCSAIIVFMSWGVSYFGDSLLPNGKNAFNWQTYGQIMLTIIVMNAVLASIPFTTTWFWFTPLAFVLSFGTLTFGWFILNLFPSLPLRGTFFITWQTPAFYFLVMVSLLINLGGLFIWNRYEAIFNPKPAQVVRERLKMGVFDVVVAPRKRGESMIVVPRSHQQEVWKGFAYETSETRFSLQRRSLTAMSSKVGAGNGSIVGGPKVPPSLEGIEEGSPFQDSDEEVQQFIATTTTGGFEAK